MREHGVLRRALVVYSEASIRLRASAGSVPPDVLARTAKLFRRFGEDYHERALEEQYIFPALRKAGGPNATLADILVVQHERGREITEYVLALATAQTIGTRRGQLAEALDGFVRMYRTHAAREDTVVFPAWKKTMAPKQLDEMSDRFEEIERTYFGKDGFEDAVTQISAVESELGIADVGIFTSPPPPRG
jgi:hemerythrin-like domain-containing protein